MGLCLGFVDGLGGPTRGSTGIAFVAGETVGWSGTRLGQYEELHRFLVENVQT